MTSPSADQIRTTNFLHSINFTSPTNAKMSGTNQPWKAVWPAAPSAAHQAPVSANLSPEEMTNQRAFGSHASNTKGRIVHLKKTACEC